MSTMYHLKLPIQAVLIFVILHCVATVPHNRDKLNEKAKTSTTRQCLKSIPGCSLFKEYFLSSNEKDDDLREGDGWLVTDLSDNPFMSFMGPRPQRELTAVNSHHIEKRKCNTATCVTQRLADFLVRSSNTIGTIYAPTNVGSSAYGKRDLLQAPIYVPF